MTVSMGSQDCCDVRVMACGCGSDSAALPRRFKTAKERQQALERYREELKKELEGVQERIQELDSK